MDADSLRLLELAEVLELVARRAQSEAGRAVVRDCRPTVQPEWVDRQRALLEDLKTHLDEETVALPELGGLDEPVDVIASLEHEELILAGAQLVTLLQLSGMLAEARSCFTPDGPVAELLAGPAIADRLAGELQRCLDPDGRVGDEAHPRLAKLRRRQARLRTRVRKALEAVLAGPQSRFLIDEPYITERGGRSVVPVRRESQGRVAGIVHGLSGSGATVFVEPLDVVELNNELQLAVEEEAELVHAILAELSGLAREQLPGLTEAAGVLAELDALAASHRFGADYDAVAAELVDDNRLLVEEARHPLLIETLGADQVVPLSIRLEPPERVLIISGPNTGGKTVALKTIGLLCLLAHCGLPVPARRCLLPRLGGVWTDMGDQQSIALSLSTFSAHVQRLTQIESLARPPCLVLLDEAGRGTDPASGAALAAALIEHLLERGVMVVATTHHPELKYLAASRPGMVNAGVGLDPQTHAPTYRLEMGVAATSSGLEIARQIGLPPALLAAAAAFRDEGETRIEEFLNELRSQRREVDRMRSDLQQRQAGLEAAGRQAAAQAERERADLQRRFEKELDKLAAEFRRAADAYIRGLEDQREASRLRRESRARQALLKEAFRQRMKAGAESTAEPERGFEICEGDTVAHPVWRTGRVVRLSGDRVTVDVGGKRVTARRDELRPAEPAAGARLPANVTLSAAGTAQPELNLVGKRVEEALARADKFLDRAVVGRLSEVLIIHGRGTGRLQKALAEFLTDHTHVASFSSDGATTVVTLHS